MWRDYAANCVRQQWHIRCLEQSLYIIEMRRSAFQDFCGLCFAATNRLGAFVLRPAHVKDMHVDDAFHKVPSLICLLVLWHCGDKEKSML